MITQSINLNLIPGGVLPRINVSQYDKGSRTLQFVLFNGPVLYSIESGTEITIQGSKPDNTAFQYSCTWSGSTVSMDIEQQMTAVAGDVICELVISNNGEILGTCNFILYVESAAVSDDAVISETELPLIERAVEAAVEAAASAASAAQSAEDASGYVETVQTAVQNAAQSATAASSSAGTAQTAAQSAAQSATDAAGYVGTAQTAVQNAAQSATDASSSAGTAQTAAQNAAQSATDASSSASSASESATDAAASAQAAAQSAASIGIATTSNAGIVKPDGTSITIDPDGTIHGNASVTVDSALSSTSVNPVQNKVITSALGKVKEIIAPVETDPAANAWTVGSQIIFNDNLYEVITAITAGDSLVAYEDDPTNANIKLADPVETQLLDLKGNLSNRNLLDNAWFTVNQRGVTSSYFADRWIRYATELTFTNNNGITISGTPSSAGENLGVQRIEWDRIKDNIGKPITLSVLIGGIIYKAVGKIETPTSSWKSHVTLEIPSLNLWFQLLTNGTSPATAQLFLKNYNTDTINVTITAFKLELGSISTLAMDTVPNYAEELLKCQRYFTRLSPDVNTAVSIAIGYAVTASDLRIEFSLPLRMRTNPSITYSNLADFRYTKSTFSGGSEPTAINSAGGEFGSAVVVKFTGTFTAGDAYEIYVTNAGYIDLSADL